MNASLYSEDWTSVCVSHTHFSAPELLDLICEVQDLGIRAQASTGFTHTHTQCLLVIRWRTWAQRARLCISGLSVCSEVDQWGSSFGPLELQLTRYSTAHTHTLRQRWPILCDIPCLWMIYWIYLIYTVCVCDDFASDTKSSNISMLTCTQITHLLSERWLNRTEKPFCKHLN